MKRIVSRLDKALIAEMPRVLFEGRVIVIQSLEEAEKAVSYLKSRSILGLDTETKPNFKRGVGMNPVALLQISSHGTCFLFRLNMIGLPECLVELLKGDVPLKVGLSLHDDFRMLNRRVKFTPGHHVELQSLAHEMGITDMSLQKLYANIFGQKISKAQQLSNWEAPVLSDAQKRYAATDAWACVRLYEEMMMLQSTGYELEVIPEPEPPAPPPLTPEQEAEKKRRQEEKRERQRLLRRKHERERRKRKRQREEKEKLRNNDKSVSQEG